MDSFPADVAAPEDWRREGRLRVAARLARGVAQLIAGKWRTLLVLHALVQVTLAALLAPLGAALAGALAARGGGAAAVGNTALVEFALSWVGAAALVLVPAVELSGAYLGQAVTLWVLAEPPVGVVRGVRDAFLATLLRLPRLAGLAAIQVAATLLVAAPFLLAGYGVYRLLLGEADINYYLEARPPRFYVAVGLAGLIAAAAGAVLVWLLVRWFLAVPVLVFEGGGPLRAMRSSARRLHGRREKALLAIGLWLAGRTLGAASLVATLSVLTWLSFGWWDAPRLSVVVWATAALLAVNVLAVVVAAGLDRTIFASLVLQIYDRGILRRHPPVDLAAGAAPSRRMVPPAVLLLLMLPAVFLIGGYAARTAMAMAERRPVLVTAHRAGAFLGPENSLAALERSIAAGADFAEIDILLSADGTPWVVHDRDLRRIAGVPLEVSRATDAQLRQVDIGRLFSAEFTGESLATLEEFLDAAEGRIPLSIELKYYGFDPRLAEVVTGMLRRRYGASVPQGTNIISLELRGLQQVRRSDPHLPLGFLVAARLGDVTRLDVDFLSVASGLFTPTLRDRARARGMRVAVWTINDRAGMLRAILAGADEIVTDEPAMAVQVRQEIEALTDAELILLRLRQTLGR